MGGRGGDERFRPVIEVLGKATPLLEIKRQMGNGMWKDRDILNRFLKVCLHHSERTFLKFIIQWLTVLKFSSFLYKR